MEAPFDATSEPARIVIFGITGRRVERGSGSEPS
jgi:hypothetical protein